MSALRCFCRDAPVLAVDRGALAGPGRARGGATRVGPRQARATARQALGARSARVGDRLRADRAPGRTGERRRAHIPGAGRGADPGRARARLAVVGRRSASSEAGAAGDPGPVRAGLGRSRRFGRRRRRPAAVGAQLRRTRSPAGGGHAAALARRGDRGDGGRRHRAGGVGPPAKAEQRAQRRSPRGGTAATSERRVRVGGDGLWRPVRRRCPRGAARQRDGPTLAARRCRPGGVTGARLRSAVLLRRRAPGHGAGCGHAARSDRSSPGPDPPSSAAPASPGAGASSVRGRSATR